MILRKKKNHSGSISVQIISKSRGKYKVIRTIGNGRTDQEIQKLYFLGKQALEDLSMQPQLFVSETDTIVESIFSSLSNGSIRVVGPELIFGKIYDKIGFNQIKDYQKAFVASDNIEVGVGDKIPLWCFGFLY